MPVPSDAAGDPEPMRGSGLVSGGTDALLPHLIAHLDRAMRCDIAVSFLLDSGARLIVEHLRDFLARGGRARILVGDYLGVTEPAALHRLLDLSGDLDLRIHQSQGVGFHLKSYIFLEDAGGAGEGFAFVGSSNISAPALTTSIEWNYRIAARRDPQGFAEIRASFERLFADYAVVRVDDDWIARYAADRGARDIRESGVVPEPPLPRPEPRGIQREALAALERTRAEGFTAGLVVLATGLGKTWLAAFDSDRPAFSRILFVAHREEILDQAVATFRRLRPAARIGRLGGGRHERDADLVFASVQTLGRAEHLGRFRPDVFDYVVVDEFHHASAATYRRVIDHFRPRFLLGLTATPDRSDGGDLLALCQENLVFQRGIADGVAGGQLCPFRYFGVPDAVDYANIPWRNARFDIGALDLALATDARARNALEQFERLGDKRCIAFCCSQRHANFMADFFLNAGIAAVAVHSGPGSAPRASSLQKLERGELRVVFAVDMFNEGVDVPLVDTVLMLRPTESSIVWMQQLGRGLRVAQGKPHLTVIDYIGNHRSFLTKLGALAGLLGREEQGPGALRDLLEAIGTGRLVLPPGCAVTYDLEARAILDALLEPSRNAALLDVFYADYIARRGQRPTALEVFHAGISPRASAERRWCRFLQRKQSLGTAPEQVLAALPAIERVEQLKSEDLGSVLVLAALFAAGGRARIADLAERLPDTARRHGVTPGKLPELAGDGAAIADWIGISILPELVERLRGPRHALLVREGDMVGLSDPGADGVAALLAEIVAWRIAEIIGAGRDIVCNVQRNGAQAPILFLPSGATGDSFPRGDIDATIDGVSLVVQVRKVAINKVVARGTKTNLLPDILRRWFGPDAGKPGTGFKVWLRRRGDRLTMEPMSLARAAEPEG
jgi:superfamily II DNA or RNA helicase/HKD family nuclease